MKRLIIYIIFFVSVTLSIETHGAEKPSITCLEVHENGDVTVHWSLDNTPVIEFIVYDSATGSTWQRVETSMVELPNHNFFIKDTAVNANLQPYFYKVVVVYATSTETSDIFNTMYMGVVENSLDPGILEFGWTPVHTPLPTGYNTYSIYKNVYKDNIPGNWELLADNILNTSYIYQVEDGICSDSVKFFVEIDDTLNNCSSISNITSGIFSETNSPENPIFDSVSIVDNSKVILAWQPSISEDAYGVIIYRNTNGWQELDTLIPNTVTHYFDTLDFNCDSFYEYAISAFDSCGNKTPGTYDKALSPMVLSSLQHDLCSESISMTWSPYINANPPLEKYQIWAIVNTNDTIVVGEVDSNTTTFSHENVMQNTDYHYFIRAIFGDYSSTSCTKSITTGTYIVPDELYFTNATVLVDNSIDLTVDIDLDPVSCTWEIYRSDAGGENLSLIKTFNRDDVNNSPFEFNDMDADGSAGYYNYDAIVYDSCGNETLISNTLKTIFLSGEKPTENSISLSWNNFEGWDAGVKKYYIYRMTDGIEPSLPYDSTDLLETQYTDNISTIPPSVTEFVYWIVAKENSGNIYGYQEESNSNRLAFVRESDLFMPNAFHPGGNNSIFKPVVAGFAGSEFSMKIFNRWGQMIYESFSPNEGWDGSIDGNLSPAGLYVYRLTYKTATNEQKDLEGTVMLIR